MVVNFYDHALVGEGSDADLDKALIGAATKLEKQVLKLRGRWRDTHRDAKSFVPARKAGKKPPRPSSKAGRPKAPAAKAKAKTMALPATKPKIFASIIARTVSPCRSKKR